LGVDAGDPRGINKVGKEETKGEEGSLFDEAIEGRKVSLDVEIVETDEAFEGFRSEEGLRHFFQVWIPRWFLWHEEYRRVLAEKHACHKQIVRHEFVALVLWCICLNV